MHKFFTPSNLFEDEYAFIEGDDVKHIFKVLRLSIGDKLVINNLQGEEYLGVIEESTKQRITVKLLEKLAINNESNLKITLYQGMPKAGKMDLIVQKTTELGVRAIVPVITDRVDVILKGEFKKLDRLQRIALEASKQSKRTIIPEVLEPVLLEDALGELKNYDLVIVPYENQENYGLKAAIKNININTIDKIAIVIGPEGGFTEEEINLLKDIGAEIITLGPRILRTETAGVVTASLLQYEMGDLGGRKE
ncbi:16S rRNA (uracil(1498)-N(3))-methyltransferase [Alloiococcus sp. CFN-8]|uniref:16S rRNA (uracil(1498)-N(3))-methyltransferase n=1 Tax=Alloiococcus sp. CFN-8 TaxID=3416081 RepID=UPI003CF18A66